MAEMNQHQEQQPSEEGANANPSQILAQDNSMPDDDQQHMNMQQSQLDQSKMPAGTVNEVKRMKN